MGKMFDRRRNFVVNPKLQRRIILSASWPLVVILGVMILVQFVLDAQLAAELRTHELELTGAEWRIVSALLFMAFALGYVGVMSLKLSHRVAGAAYRLSQTLTSFREGDRDVRAKLRQDDFLTELQDDLNSFLDWTRSELEAGGPARALPAQRTERLRGAEKPAATAEAGS